ncbi:tetratricopeptide repeat protein [Janthinobacterium sp. PC23-8]|uniref:tetratricopeptide repeat protein n=1 Tax=Janthinobacterium sp. PC23-8 TaxID=2012679 RepID=UPI000B97089A|nr:tetratricopeptide repeat protein [Janthinobacterium sp. PC23-8]OYO26675.1 hypothetical protein CD932_26120 [Janthinobacterium sp. PC23-8]
MLFAEGNDHLNKGDAVAAVRCFLHAHALAPDKVEILANLGYAQEQAGMWAAAADSYRQALALRHDSVQIMQNLAMLLLKSKQFVEAEALCRRALQAQPDEAGAWSNLGVLLACLQRETQAEQCYRAALERDPLHGKARFNLAYLLLRQGRLEEGWQMLEGRALPDIFGAFFNCPRWSGEPLSGRAIVVCLEAGQGDMIQFCRYCSVLKQAGAYVALVCHPALKTLLTSLPGVDQVFSSAEAIPGARWDFWVPLLSLPGLCGTRLHTIPAPVPYLAADPALAARWKTRLPSNGMKVGLAWKGNPAFENDADRSLPSLDTLAPLGALQGLALISLQKGAGQEDRSDFLDMLHPVAALRDFSDTAAVIANLDLVISVDTAVAHLAGALGKQCWLLLPDYRADWRWLAGRCDTAWYPSMRLFRQPSIGGWAPLITHVAAELAHWRQLHG